MYSMVLNLGYVINFKLGYFRLFCFFESIGYNIKIKCCFFDFKYKMSIYLIRWIMLILVENYLCINRIDYWFDILFWRKNNYLFNLFRGIIFCFLMIVFKLIFLFFRIFMDWIVVFN